MGKLFITSSVSFPIRPRWKVWTFLVAIGLSGAIMIGKALQSAVAATLRESVKASDLRKALGMDPANPELYYRLGLIHSFSMEEINPTEAIKNLRQATVLSPYDSSYWSSLASACDSMSDTVCADQAMERALRLNPMTPHLYWIAANHYLRTGQTDTAFAYFQHLLELSPDYAWTTFRLCLRVSDDPEVVYQKILPAGKDPKLKLAYMNFLSAKGDANFAFRVWGRVVADAPPFTYSSVEPYVQRLIEGGRVREAQSVWLDLERLRIVQKPRTEDSDNLIYNGDFEQVPLNAGFDWRYRDLPYTSIEFSDAGALRGAHCLHLDFTVSANEELEPVFQFVPVAPNHSYLLTAYARSSDIVSDSGPRLRVIDPACRDCLDVSSETTVGTTTWHPLRLSFTTGAKTNLIRLAIWRARCRTFPYEITGDFWLDDVSLKATSPGSERVGPPSVP